MIQRSSFLMVGEARTARRPKGRPWSPASLDLDGWWDATVAETITQSGGSVSQWLDKSGSGNDVTQSNGSRQPSTGTRVINGLNALEFANDKLDSIVGSRLGRKLNGAMVIAVVEPDTLTKTDTIFQSSTPNGSKARMKCLNNLGQWAAGGQRLDGDMDAELDFAAPAFSLAPHIFVSIFDWANAQVNVSIDGTLGVAQAFQTAGFTSDTDAAGVAIGGQPTGNSNLYEGTIGELVVTKEALAFSRHRVEGYLAWKWGLEASLPIGHPYKAAPPITP